jgi:pimeloyl-ACP methyl ester carboxylesterase
MASPIELDIPSARFVRQASILVKYWPRSRRKRRQLEREGLDTYRVSPLWAIAGIFETCNVLRQRAERLTVPVLYVRSPNDHKTLLTQPDKFRKYFPNTPTTFRDAENSPHAMLQGPEREQIQQWISEWVDQHS